MYLGMGQVYPMFVQYIYSKIDSSFRIYPDLDEILDSVKLKVVID